MLKTALFDSAINEKCCSVDWGRGICPLFSSPPRGIWQLKSPQPLEFAIQGKKILMPGGKPGGGGGRSWERLELTDALGPCSISLFPKHFSLFVVTAYCKSYLFISFFSSFCFWFLICKPCYMRTLINLSNAIHFHMHQSIPAAPSPPPGADPRKVFFCLGWQTPGGGDSWAAVKSPGMGRKKEGKCPVLHQHLKKFFIDRTVE